MNPNNLDIIELNKKIQQLEKEKLNENLFRLVFKKNKLLYLINEKNINPIFQDASKVLIEVKDLKARNEAYLNEINILKFNADDFEKQINGYQISVQKIKIIFI